MTLTTTAHSPQQLMVVWNRLLPDESEGPTLISHTALRSRTLRFYIRTPLSHSGHTVIVAQQDAIFDGRRPAVALPPIHVMNLAPAGMHVALGPGALAVAGDHRAALGPGEHALGASQVQR